MKCLSRCILFLIVLFLSTACGSDNEEVVIPLYKKLQNTTWEYTHSGEVNSSATMVIDSSGSGYIQHRTEISGTVIEGNKWNIKLTNNNDDTVVGTVSYTNSFGTETGNITIRLWDSKRDDEVLVLVGWDNKTIVNSSYRFIKK